jgi:hypothetical protein
MSKLESKGPSWCGGVSEGADLLGLETRGVLGVMAVHNLRFGV